MKKLALAALFLGALASQSAHPAYAQGASNVPYSDCADVVKIWIVDLTTAPPNGLTPEQVSKLFLEPAAHPTCLASVMPSISRPNLLKVLAEHYGNSTQQSSPAGSSGATSSVSKPSGTTSLIQDVGGFSATNNGSSLTLQFAPGDLFEQLASNGVFDLCTSTIQSRHCKSKTWLKVLAPATLSVTTNTTTPGSSVSGTAAGTGTAVPVTLKSMSNTLSFGGVTAKYAFLYRNKTSDGTIQPASLIDAASAEAKSLSASVGDFSTCREYASWRNDDRNIQEVTNEMVKVQTERNQEDLLSFMLSRYTDLVKGMLKDPTCKEPLSRVRNVLNTVSAYQEAIAAQEVIATSSTPLLGLEYDFITPANKPSYHTAKLNFSWQSSASCTAQVQVGAKKTLKTVTPEAATCAPNKGTKTTNSLTPASASPTWTISASGGADIYNDEPSSTIPSASRLRDVQAGAEITFITTNVLKKSTGLSQFFSTVGDPSVVFAYYYQDQTSPSILKGPPSSITFNGLPTTASQVFATRGPINVGQIRLGFGTGKNVKFPIAVSYSNRSDLIVHPFVGVQFGISYDLFGK